VRVIRFTETYTLEAGDRTYVIHEHLCEPRGAAPLQAGDDAAEARWVAPADLEALGVHADARAVIGRALAGDSAGGPGRATDVR
jgi:hypothetical protein